MFITAQIEYDDETKMEGEALARKVAERLSELFDDEDLPASEHARRVVVWPGKPVIDVSGVPNVAHPRDPR